jgi:hypothetical protein
MGRLACARELEVMGVVLCFLGVRWGMWPVQRTARDFEVSTFF